MSMRKKIQDVLLKLGVTPNLKGFSYICDAVEMISKEGRLKVTYIYDKIARDNNEKTMRVERAIRHAISHVNEETWKSIGGGTGLKNSEFLFTLELLIREGEKHE